uniref:MULE transposase domain-containing protein n=1 Tax=Lactuca sativa TaxID=4236 RepID=A0A9R1XSN9_LACSA|nr:hypothetical protein LSAT_V11C300138950 [Lactuca sativa]
MGAILDLGQLNQCGPSQSNKGSEENKCTWVLYASKWEQEFDLEIKTYEKEHRCLQRRNVFRDKTEALNQVRGDYAGQYTTTLRDYVQELRTRNPGTTVKIEVESEPNPAFETRTFKRIYICLGQLKKGFLAHKRYYIRLDGTFMKGPYPGMILTAVGLDENNCTYPLAYVVVEAENINSWTWFLRCLGDDIDLQANSNVTFISDKQKRGKGVSGHVVELCKYKNNTRIHTYMEELRKLNNDCHEWVKAIPPQHWSRVHFTGRSACDDSSRKKGKAEKKAKSVSDGSSIKKGKDGKKDQSVGDGSSSKKGNVGKKAQSAGGGRQSGTQSACDGI